MLKNLIEKMVGSYSDREIRRIQPLLSAIEALDPTYRALSESELKGKTAWLKDRLAKGETLDDILPDAFATVREASARVLNMRHFPVQLIGGIILHQGRIAEMKTGEGKTLVATLPAYLNALSGKGVYVVTVNDYLALRDSEWMGKLYRYLGLSVGLIVHDLDGEARKAAYAADITYGTNNEFGFDYLRDNMVVHKDQMVQRGQNFAIVDEVDSILIDEARTPLIISGIGDRSTDLYEKANEFVLRLKSHRIKEADQKVDMDEEVDADYIIDEKAKSASLTLKGIKKAEAHFGVENWSDPDNMTLSHHVNQAIKAHGTMHRDRDYVVKDDQVIIVDDFTGRLMMGRRYSDGLHQAIEAKEKVKVAHESKTLATITFQNYFRLFSKLSGMTGTALTEEREFQDIYKLDVVVIPTNKPMIRQDLPDCVYKNTKGKYEAVLDEIERRHATGQPVLVGTISIEVSELLSNLLKKRGIKHSVLNAKQHEKEAEIVAQAGRKGAVTIATNMAGRGTDIILGGNADFMARHDLKKEGYEDDVIEIATGFAEVEDETVLEARRLYQERLAFHKAETATETEEVIAAGGLCIIGTERHESRRIDNQLRGRAGRQGDRGVSRFYISLEDELMRLFGGERTQRMVEALGLPEDQAIENKMLTSAIENAQRRIEERNFNIRKNVLQYDDVMNMQRNMIYGQRQQVLEGNDMHESILGMLKNIISETVHRFAAESPYAEEWDWDALRNYFSQFFLREGDLPYTKEECEDLTPAALIEDLTALALERYAEVEERLSPELMREAERVFLLRAVDAKWMDHIDDVDRLKQGIGLRAFAQHDPVVEFRMETEIMYDDMIESIKETTLKNLFHARVAEPAPARPAMRMQASHGNQEEAPKTPQRAENKVGRNDLCPCGSGKKYKKCCGQ
ncbi:MAG: preprotein translocase subunit SecA [Clostridia bacterium]|nr:preprotein translocase subunit SecA [Clostridia bacterium]